MKLAALGLTALLIVSTAFAHHSPIVFDRTKQVTITGTVTEFRWGNPHSWIHIDVADKDGKVGNWAVEMDPASHLAREGWKSSTLKPGDKISVTFRPMKDGSNGGMFMNARRPTGEVLSMTGQPIDP